MPKTRFCLFIAKLGPGLCMLLGLLLLLPINTVAKTPTNNPVYGDRYIRDQLVFLGSDNLWPFKKDTWLFKDYGAWRGTLWVGSESQQIAKEVAPGSNLVFNDIRSLRVRPVAGQKKPLFNNLDIITDKITFDDLPKPRELYFFANYPTDILKTVVNLPKLEALDLSYNKIDDMRKLAVLNTPNLQYLDLSSNSIRLVEMPDNGLRPRELVMRGNGIKMVMLTDQPKLEALDLSGNQIENLSKLFVLETPALQYLNLSDNGISRAELPNSLPRLKELILSNNKISEIALDNLPMLESLDLSNNAALTSLHGINKLAALKKLDISDTRITSLAGLEGMVNLKELRVDYVRNLKTFEDLGKLPNLHFLHVTESGINRMSGLEGLTNLRELYLSGVFYELIGLDNLQKLEKLTVRSHNGLPQKIEGLDNLKALRELDLSGSFTRIAGLDNLTQLEKLTLSSPLLRQIEGLDKLVNLKSLDLWGDYYSKIENLDKLANLETLRLRGNPSITKLENLEALVNLKELALPGSNVADITKLGGLPRPEILETLNLRGNKIETFNNVPLLPNLKNLDLAATEITAFNDIQHLPNLQNLNLSYTSLGDGFDSINGYQNLETLDLSNTKISNIKHLTGLTKLRELDLSQNTLESLDGLETLVNLQWLNLKESQLTAIKSIPPSLRYLQMKRTTISDLHFLHTAQEALNLQVLIANDSKIGGMVDFSRAVNLRYINLDDSKLAGVIGFESLPYDAELYLNRNSLPLSQIYPLTQDVSYRVWEIGRQRDVFFEKLELKRNQPLDFSSEKEFGGKSTKYFVFRKIADGNDALSPPGKWESASLNEDYTISDGIIIFLKPGEYYITMKNEAVLQYPQDFFQKFKPYPIVVYTGIITVL